jgi:hypothetical protein
MESDDPIIEIWEKAKEVGDLKKLLKIELPKYKTILEKGDLNLEISESKIDIIKAESVLQTQINFAKTIDKEKLLASERKIFKKPKPGEKLTYYTIDELKSLSSKLGYSASNKKKTNISNILEFLDKYKIGT